MSSDNQITVTLSVQNFFRASLQYCRHEKSQNKFNVNAYISNPISHSPVHLICRLLLPNHCCLATNLADYCCPATMLACYCCLTKSLLI